MALLSESAEPVGAAAVLTKVDARGVSGALREPSCR